MTAKNKLFPQDANALRQKVNLVGPLSGTMLNGDVRKLETREEHEPKQVKGGYCSLLQISETLAKTDDIASTGRIV